MPVSPPRSDRGCAMRSVRLPVSPLALATLLAALAAFAILGAGTSHADSTYDPATEVKFCNAMDSTFVDEVIAGNAACADDLSTGTAADFWTKRRWRKRFATDASVASQSTSFRPNLLRPTTR